MRAWNDRDPWKFFLPPLNDTRPANSKAGRLRFADAPAKIPVAHFTARGRAEYGSAVRVGDSIFPILWRCSPRKTDMVIACDGAA
jgi:hypothetical protein